MNPQYSHQLTESFILYLDNKILSNNAFTNETADFSQIKGRVNGFNYFSSNAAQFVSDSSIVGADIPSQITIDGVPTLESSNLYIDFMNGGCYYNGSGSISASYSRKDFNVYMSTEHYSTVFMNRLGSGENLYIGNKKPSSPFDFTAPCILVSLHPENNKAHAIGGTRKTEIKVEVVSIGDNYYKMSGLSSILTDMFEKCFPLLDFGADSPYGIYGNLKGNYNYQTLYNSRMSDSTRPILIKEVSSMPITSINGNDNGNFSSFIFLTKFTLEDIR